MKFIFVLVLSLVRRRRTDGARDRNRKNRTSLPVLDYDDEHAHEQEAHTGALTSCELTKWTDKELEMNPINPGKLLNSKWTAVNPQNREKHFIVTKCPIEKGGQVEHIEIEAVLTRNTYRIHWHDLRDGGRWEVGWR